MRRPDLTAKLLGLLKVQPHVGESQAIESICFTILALRHDTSARLEMALHTLRKLQDRDGSWPSFCWR